MNCNCVICQNNKPFDMPGDIIDAALKENLVLFCGAGISTESRTVLPYSFYSSIKSELDIHDETISFSTLMQKYCSMPNGRKKLLKKIKERFDYIHSFPELEYQASAFHDELAPIHQIKTIITTNWDTYFEEYCGCVPITIPEDFAFWDETSRCVLKIHGSIKNLSTIIATEDDYQKCFDGLQKGIVGATLKTILATKTVVFVGFSFGDEDLKQIMDYLRSEMGEIYPHIYLVTLDDQLQKRINYKNCTQIVTSGTFFIHQLKLHLIEQNAIVNYFAYPIVEEALHRIIKLHQQVSNIDLVKYPCAIFTLSHQDGVIHALQRFIQNRDTGEYYVPGRLGIIAGEYEKMEGEFLEQENYWNAAYYNGYTDGLVLIGICEEEPEALDKFPFLFLPNATKELTDFEVYMEELQRISKGRSKYQKYAKNIVKNKNVNDSIVVHHPPY